MDNKSTSLARSPRRSTGDKSGLCDLILCLSICLFVCLFWANFLVFGRRHSIPLWILSGYTRELANTSGSRHYRPTPSSAYAIHLQSTITWRRPKTRKFAQNRQTNTQRIQLQRPLLSPVDRWGERANITLLYIILVGIILPELEG